MRYSQLTRKMFEVLGPSVWSAYSTPSPDAKLLPKLTIYQAAFSVSVSYYGGVNAEVPDVVPDAVLWYCSLLKREVEVDTNLPPRVDDGDSGGGLGVPSHIELCTFEPAAPAGAKRARGDTRFDLAAPAGVKRARGGDTRSNAPFIEKAAKRSAKPTLKLFNDDTIWMVLLTLPTEDPFVANATAAIQAFKDKANAIRLAHMGTLSRTSAAIIVKQQLGTCAVHVFNSVLKTAAEIAETEHMHEATEEIERFILFLNSTVKFLQLAEIIKHFTVFRGSGSARNGRMEIHLTKEAAVVFKKAIYPTMAVRRGFKCLGELKPIF